MLGTADGQNAQSAQPVDNQQPDGGAPQPAADDNTSQTGTVFAPSAAAPAPVDPLSNPYDLGTEPPATPTVESPPPPPPAKQKPAKTKAKSEPAIASGQSGDLMSIKQQALQSLTPLVDKLDQPPEDKYKTLMMVVQASDNPDLIKKAYDAANQIKDEKERAQALLDIVSEINYFTQKQQPGA